MEEEIENDSNNNGKNDDRLLMNKEILDIVPLNNKGKTLEGVFSPSLGNDIIRYILQYLNRKNVWDLSSVNNSSYTFFYQVRSSITNKKWDLIKKDHDSTIKNHKVENKNICGCGSYNISLACSSALFFTGLIAAGISALDAFIYHNTNFREQVTPWEVTASACFFTAAFIFCCRWLCSCAKLVTMEKAQEKMENQRLLLPVEEVIINTADNKDEHTEVTQLLSSDVNNEERRSYFSVN